MIISNFEIGRSLNDYESKYQYTHYQLQITNIEDNEIEFLIETHTAAITSNSSMFINVITTINNAEITFLLPFRQKNKEYIQGVYFKLASKASAIFEMKPTDQDGLLFGYIVLRVPPIRSESKRFLVTIQQSEPVRVLLSASRLDYRRWALLGLRDRDGNVDYTTSAGGWFSSQSIELSSGKAENEIDPEGLGMTTKIKEFLGLTKEQNFEPKMFPGALLLAEEDRIPALLDILSIIENDEQELKALNELLVDNGARVRVHVPENKKS